MRKSLLIIMAVAILGGIGLYVNKGSDNSAVMADATTSAPAAKQPVVASSSPTTAPAAATAADTYQDGTYTGSQASTIYGTVQVAAVISGGKITDIKFIQMPNEQENSKVVATMAEPGLKASAINKQSAHIDFVSGATQDSQGFEQSLQNALNQAAS